MVSERSATPRSLDKEAGRPLYVQLYELLRERVRRGELKPGDLVPAESELVRAYGVSRITVRAALDQLVHDGYIDRHRGRGSFVRSAAPEPRACLTSFTDQMLALGRRPEARVLGVRVASAAELAEGSFAAATPLPFTASTEVAEVERIRLLDGDPVALVRSYIPHELVRGIGADAFASDGPAQSLLFVLEHRFGLVLDKGEETILPARARADVAERLGIPEGEAVALKICLVRDLVAAPVLFEVAAWCAPQTQLVQRVAAPS